MTYTGECSDIIDELPYFYMEFANSYLYTIPPEYFAYEDSTTGPT